MDGVLFGLVALSGKVVEHEHGYRAERARVVAAAVLSVGKLSLGADPQWIEDVFARPADAHRPRRGYSGEPPRCRDLYLTLEIFAGSGANPRTLLDQIRVSVEYWRRWIPEDGRTLDQILAGGPAAVPSESRRGGRRR